MKSFPTDGPDCVPVGCRATPNRMLKLCRGYFRRISGFSLIEVSLAIGVVSFSMLAMLAVLPVGLRTFRDSKVETALGGIQRQVRAEAVQQWTNFDGKTLYFSDEGIAVDAIQDAYFAATASLSAPSAPGLPSGATNSLQNLGVKVVFPVMLPDTARTTNEFRILLARQAGERAD